MIFGLIILLLWSMMSGAFVFRMTSGKSGWIDAIWSFSIALSGLIAAWAPFNWASLNQRQIIIGLLILAAYFRLGLDISLRTYRGGDDPRYIALEKKWGKNFNVHLYIFLQIQALCALILSIAIFLAARNPEPITTFKSLLGLIIVIIAIIGEALADKQLRDFKKESTSKKICNQGLWAVSRHPNYFFEWLNWVGIALLAINLNGDWSVGFFALTAPLMMYLLLRYASGVPHVEKHLSSTRPDEFQEYKRKVNVFFPGFPK